MADIAKEMALLLISSHLLLRSNARNARYSGISRFSSSPPPSEGAALRSSALLQSASSQRRPWLKNENW